MTSIELLAPARDLTTALEAIRHGADAVYIGARRFGARAAAGNSVEDIRELCRQAHVFRVKVYVTLNTILLDDELEETRRLAWELYEAGVDALIVQDMALLELDLPPIPLHASTQMDNRTAEKVRWLHSLGFEQAVLARELTLEEMAAIHREVPEMPLEVFVHGSICVSYNGQCYASQHCFGRSANRGECAHFCRLPFDLEDAEGNVIERQRHLLSLRDMNRSADLEPLLDAGAVSLKIEGRLKDVGYVKNVVAYYRQALDRIFARRPEYVRASLGQHSFQFEPRLEASFNRGFTSYFLHGRTPELGNPATPKSMGEFVGTVKEVRRDCIVVSGVKPFANGDGLCFLDADKRLQGFRVNRAENNRLYPQQMPAGLAPRMRLYRNQDHDFEALLARPTAERRIPLRWCLAETAEGFALSAKLPDGREARMTFVHPHEEARSPQQEAVLRQLSRLGDTPFLCEGADVCWSANWFIPGSVLAEWRRAVVASLLDIPYTRPERRLAPASVPPAPFHGQTITYLGNVSNLVARDFYLKAGAAQVGMTLEAVPAAAGAKPLLMTCRYCVLYQLGHCTREGRVPLPQPLYLRLANGRRFPLQFDCRNCQMKVYAE